MTKSLTVVIPALDEEEAIGATITRCLEAGEQICTIGGLRSVEWIVVSDGSTDRTVEIAHRFDEVKTIVFPENRGYGAAIMEGWRRGKGELVGVLDADGTCDPLFFGEMCRVMEETSAEVVIGSRLGPDSKMPRLRRIGNRFFAFLLTVLCGRRVTDTASGMRIVKRQALPDLMPLPDGLHFTPSMSAHALLNSVKIVEIPMSYHERIGQSKLHVVHDGVRFLKTMIDGVLCYRPEKLFFIVFWIAMVVGVGMAAYPSLFYLKHRRLEEWMIYRFVACFLLASFQILLLMSAALANRMAELSSRRRAASKYWPSFIATFFRGYRFVLSLLLLGVMTIAFLWPGIVEYATTGTVTLHWSRLLAGAFGLFSIVQMAIFAILMKVILIWSTLRRSRDAAKDDAND